MTNAQYEPSEGKFQNFCEYTVQIRSLGTDKVLGAGIIVSESGIVLTCHHVVKEAGITIKTLGIKKVKSSSIKRLFRRGPDDKEVVVYFPYAPDGSAKRRRAIVTDYLHEYYDDLAVLELVEGPFPLRPSQVAKLGVAEKSCYHPFKSLGFWSPPGAEYITVYDVEGQVRIKNPTQEMKRLPLKMLTGVVQLKAKDIDRGMSGAGVLDVEQRRNVVVGLVSDAMVRSDKHSGDAWAVDALIVTFPVLTELNLSVQDSWPLSALPLPPYIDEAQAAAISAPGEKWDGAPELLKEWVGREELLKATDDDWDNPHRRVVGLIGFGGEGKTSLARRWVSDLLSASSKTQPNGVFWWSFYKNGSVDEFFERTLLYLSGSNKQLRDKYQSSSSRAVFIPGMLYQGRYLFVLDGLEVLQHQGIDQYGRFKNADLRTFLEFVATPGHQSFCLITSRAPIYDLANFTTYGHHYVERLSSEDGRELLFKLGVRGPDEALYQLVEEWDGHALILVLLAADLVSRHGGDITRLDEIKPRIESESRYQRVSRVLEWYDSHLTDPEQVFLTLFSAFRASVQGEAFTLVFRAKMDVNALNSPLVFLDDLAFGALIKHLADSRILRHDQGTPTRNYTVHPLIREFYRKRFGGSDPAQTRRVHNLIKDYYLYIAGDMPELPTLDELAPLFEAVHHAILAGAYDEAFDIYLQRIEKATPMSTGRVLTYQLGQYQKDLELVQEFFPDPECTAEPLVTNRYNKRYLINEAGLCWMTLGQLEKARPLFERCITLALDIEEDWNLTSINYQNLAELYIHLGKLHDSARAVSTGLDIARNAKIKFREWRGLAYQAWGAHLRGEIEAAGRGFQEAERVQREDNSSIEHLHDLWGVWHADHLRRIDEGDHARRVVEENKCLYEETQPEILSQCHRVLGDLDSNKGNHGGARRHYDEAIKVVRRITHSQVLIEALLGRGSWAARQSEIEVAWRDLDEALRHATAGGYRIFEADVRVGLAWAHFAAKDATKARAETERAQSMSDEMNYYWGRVDAAEIISVLDQVG